MVRTFSKVTAPTSGNFVQLNALSVSNTFYSKNIVGDKTVGDKYVLSIFLNSVTNLEHCHQNNDVTEVDIENEPVAKASNSSWSLAPNI